jgi:hypothetical protein
LIGHQEFDEDAVKFLKFFIVFYIYSGEDVKKFGYDEKIVNKNVCAGLLEKFFKMKNVNIGTLFNLLRDNYKLWVEVGDYMDDALWKLTGLKDVNILKTVVKHKNSFSSMGLMSEYVREGEDFNVVFKNSKMAVLNIKTILGSCGVGTAFNKNIRWCISIDLPAVADHFKHYFTKNGKLFKDNKYKFEELNDLVNYLHDKGLEREGFIKGLYENAIEGGVAGAEACGDEFVMMAFDDIKNRYAIIISDACDFREYDDGVITDENSEREFLEFLIKYEYDNSDRHINTIGYLREGINFRNIDSFVLLNSHLLGNFGNYELVNDSEFKNVGGGPYYLNEKDKCLIYLKRNVSEEQIKYFIDKYKDIYERTLQLQKDFIVV